MLLRNKFISAILLAIFALFFQPADAAADKSREVFQKELEETSNGKLLVKFKPKISDEKEDEIYGRYESTFEDEYEKVKIKRVKVPDGKQAELLKKYEDDPDVLYAEPDYTARAFLSTNDPSLSTQWDMFKIQAASSSGLSAWDIAGGQGVKIAVLDSGIDEAHPDLAGKIVASRNFSSAPSASDGNGHGTHVAGTIAAIGNNGTGVAGVAYNAELMNVKVLGDDGSGAYSSIIDGITWATDNGARVINMSLGSANSSKALEDAINYAWSKGVVVVVAAGNDGNTIPQYPAYYDKVIAVGSTNRNDQKSSFSTYGSWVDVAAPGENIYSTYTGSSYKSLSGTSMAAPHVAALAGLIMSQGSTGNQAVRDKIEATSDKISGTGSDWTYGRINAFSAVSGTNNGDVSPKPYPRPPYSTSSAPVYRFWSDQKNRHFFTISRAERDDIISNDKSWKDEGVAFSAYENYRPGNVPVYRFWSDQKQSHFFTISEPEKDNTIRNDKSWTYEGIAFFTMDAQQPGSVPVYRLWNGKKQTHFFTVSASEKDALVSEGTGWQYEGIAFNAY